MDYNRNPNGWQDDGSRTTEPEDDNPAITRQQPKTFESLAPTAIASTPAPRPVHPASLMPPIMATTAVLVTGALLFVLLVRRPPYVSPAYSSGASLSLYAPAAISADETAVGAAADRDAGPEPLGALDLVNAAHASDAVESRVSACFAPPARPVSLRVAITLAPGGYVSGVDLQEPNAPAAGVKGCVVHAYGGMRADAFEGEEVTFLKAFRIR
jgi:hypothetical protein